MSDTSQGPGWWQAADGLWYSPESHPDYRSPQQSSGPLAATMPEVLQTNPPATMGAAQRSFNELHPIKYKGGWIGLFGGENQAKALQRALPQINASGLRVVAAVEDRWSVWKRLGVILLLIVTLGFVGKVPNVLLITEPMG